jgi:hypothetical protein
VQQQRLKLKAAPPLQNGSDAARPTHQTRSHLALTIPDKKRRPRAALFVCGFAGHPGPAAASATAAGPATTAATAGPAAIAPVATTGPAATPLVAAPVLRGGVVGSDEELPGVVVLVVVDCVPGFVDPLFIVVWAIAGIASAAETITAAVSPMNRIVLFLLIVRTGIMRSPSGGSASRPSPLREIANADMWRMQTVASGRCDKPKWICRLRCPQRFEGAGLQPRTPS